MDALSERWIAGIANLGFCPDGNQVTEAAAFRASPVDPIARVE